MQRVQGEFIFGPDLRCFFYFFLFLFFSYRCAAGSSIHTTHPHQHPHTQLPPLDYLTLFDKYIFCVYICILVQLLSSFGVVFLFRREHDSGTISHSLKEELYAVSRTVCLSRSLLISSRSLLRPLVGLFSHFVKEELYAVSCSVCQYKVGLF